MKTHSEENHEKNEIHERASESVCSSSGEELAQRFLEPPFVCLVYFVVLLFSV